jgi:hypothetical protein
MKNIIVFCLIAFSLTACNTTTKTEEKIDFTKSYETAALALTDAQLLYDVAIVGKDSLKIANAKMKLETAKTVYLKSKDVYTSNGGVANPKYEQLLAKTNTTLGKGPNDTTTVINIASPKSVSSVIKAPLATAVKMLDSGNVTVNKKIQQVSKAAAVNEQAVKKSLTTAKQDLKKASDTTKKRIEEFKKQTGIIRDLFK